MPTPEYDGVVTSELDESAEDKRLLVKIFLQAVKNEAKSSEAGRPIFDEIPMIQIITPGSRDVMVNKLNDKYKERFPRHWERFQKGLEQLVEGTPLDEVPFLTVGQIAELKAVNCLTLEHLASMSDQLAQKMMGMHALRKKAKDYLDAAAGHAPIAKLQNQVDQLMAQVEALTNQNSKLSKELEKTLDKV
ncbi:MAG: hypothetical protein E6Q97_17895 [Desulfurellales bacterium]|nr:MAG: hypothetical protein E6Q97_17895 [Desulfurellales bacterium]